ncbi:MAG: T9SS type A sorting domain-containing protein, partial [FCB group bacterium]
FDTVWYRHNYNKECYFACFANDTTKILTAMDSTIYILDIQNGNIIDSMEKAPSIFADNWNLSKSLNGKRIASTLYDGRAVVWDVPSKKIIKIFDSNFVKNFYMIYSVALSPDGHYLIGGAERSISYDKTECNILIYDLDNNKIVQWMDDWNNTRSPANIIFSPDGKYFIMDLINFDGSRRGEELSKYSVNGWQKQKVLETIWVDTYSDLSYYQYLSYSNDSKYLAGSKTNYHDSIGACYIWDMEADTIFRIYSSNKLGNQFYFINISPDNKYLLFGGGDHFYETLLSQIWDFANDTSVYQTNIYSADGIEYSDNGKYLLLASGYEIYLLTPNWTNTGINDLPQEQTKDIYPNPASDFLNINSEKIIGKDISIYDMLGNKLLSIIAESTDTRINIETLPIGVYIVKFGELTKLFVKK